MHLYVASQNVLSQLYQVVEKLSKEEYTIPLTTLNNSTLGQHVRHTIEFFLCLQQGLESGIVNYDNRKRDSRIENEPSYSLKIIEELSATISTVHSNPELILEGSYSESGAEQGFSIATNFHRELAYNIEHAVHHMAIIKIGLTETHPAMEIPANFGVAVSTVRYNN